jgi:hypothetical protein
MEINNFDHGEREEEKSGNDQKAQERGVYGMLGKVSCRKLYLLGPLKLSRRPEC